MRPLYLQPMLFLHSLYSLTCMVDVLWFKVHYFVGYDLLLSTTVALEYSVD